MMTECCDDFGRCKNGKLRLCLLIAKWINVQKKWTGDAIRIRSNEFPRSRKENAYRQFFQ